MPLSAAIDAGPRHRALGRAIWDELDEGLRLVKTGGRLVKHARYNWLLLGESHLTRRLFEAMLRRIWALPARPADGCPKESGGDGARLEKYHGTEAVPANSELEKIADA
jgi:hypothetical protein